MSYLHLVLLPCSIQACPCVWHICHKVHGLAGWLLLNYCQRMVFITKVIMIPARWPMTRGIALGIAAVQRAHVHLRTHSQHSSYYRNAVAIVHHV